MKTNTAIEWLANKQILLVTQRNHMTPLDIVLTFDEVVDTLREWPANRPYLGLWDASLIERPLWNPKVAPRIEDVRNAISPFRKGRFAAVIRKKSGARFISMNVEFLFLKGNHEVEYQQFYDYEEALAWLKEWL